VKPTRRAFLKTVAVAPVAVAVVSGDLGPVAAASSGPPAYPWQWWVSLDGESYFDWFPTREAAIRFIWDYGGGVVAECKQGDFDLGISGDSILEVLNGQNADVMGEDGEFLDCTVDQEKELGQMVSAVIEAWVRKHNISTVAYQFDGIRNKVRVAESGEVTVEK
jgi:hypothetical protein